MGEETGRPPNNLFRGWHTDEKFSCVNEIIEQLISYH
jgi:hypothetical protein